MCADSQDVSPLHAEGGQEPAGDEAGSKWSRSQILQRIRDLNLKRSAQSSEEQQNSSTTEPAPAPPSERVVRRRFGQRFNDWTQRHQVGIEPESEQNADQQADRVRRLQQSTPPLIEQQLQQHPEQAVGGKESERKIDSSSGKAREEPAAGEREKNSQPQSPIQSTTQSNPEQPQGREVEGGKTEIEKGGESGMEKAELKIADVKGKQMGTETKDAGAATGAEDKEAKNEVLIHSLMHRH